MAKAILYDATKCTACRACQVACKQWNELSAEKTSNRGTYENPPDLSANTWVKIRFGEVSEDGEWDIKWLFTRHACMHCTDASCVALCPSNAAYKNDYGFVAIDPLRCIGCGVCEKFCPFAVPHVDNEACKARKCWACLNRVANDMTPACVKTCPTEALRFGERRELLDYARNAVADSGSKTKYLYGREELGGLHVLYLLSEPPEVHGLPERPEVPNPFEAYAFLEESLAGSPYRDKVLSMAEAKYFGHAYV